MAAAPSIDQGGAGVELAMSPAIVPFVPGNSAVSAAGGAAVVTADADTSRPNVVGQIHCGYSAAPAAGSTIKVEDGAGTTVWQMPIVDAGVKDFTFNLPKGGTTGRAMIVTLSAGGGAVVGYLYADIYKHL